ncbi:MAG: ParB/RepB/Spo0J family partition protein [Syntrophus sp. (in: bacteria)]
MATTKTYKPNQLYAVPLTELQADPNQPRKYLDPQALEELAASVTQHGVLDPILFRQDKETSTLYVVAGERRCAAARKANLITVPAVFIDSENYAEIALVENLLRQDLNPVEEAEALKRLQDDHAYKQEDLARIIGKSTVNISETLSLTKLPQEIRDECRQDPTAPKNFLITLARNKQERSMLSQYAKYKQQRAKAAEKTSPASVRRNPAEALAASLEASGKKVAAIDLNTLTVGDRSLVIDAITNLKDTLGNALSTVLQ